MYNLACFVVLINWLMIKIMIKSMIFYIVTCERILKIG